MFQYIFASVRPQYDLLLQLNSRDLPLQLASIYLLCAMCWSIGHPVAAVMVAVLVTLSEFLLFHLLRGHGPFYGISKNQRILLSLALSAIAIVLYTMPAIFMAGDPSLAVKVTGLIWVMGVQVYLANTWTRIPVALVSMLLPAILMMVLIFLNLGVTEPTQSSATAWGFAFGFLCLFIYSAFDSLRIHFTTESDLLLAQKDAATRLALLEESQRHDLLTGLLNRTAFDAALQVMLYDRNELGGEIAVFLVDLDGFKPINDTYSHNAGDEVLLQVANRLKNFVGDNGVVGRLGGDEFVCAVWHLATPTEAIEFGETLQHAMSGLILWKERQLRVNASIGIATTGDDPAAPPATVSALCSAADQAMFASKSSANSTPVLYQKHRFAPRMTPEDKQALIEGIASGALHPYFQPKVHLPTGQIIGFEALARWDHPTKGIQQPSDFIFQINELGLQGDFLISLMNKVIEGIAFMLDQGLDPGQVSLNLPEVALATYSGRQDLNEIVSANPEVAKHLTFEITEDVFIARAADTIQASIATFRAQGVRISLDDFGTGFASFHHLRQLDFDELKIDTSFVKELGTNATSEVLVRGFLNIASGLGVSVIAEGVETEDQRRDLINMGCLTAQGYLFSEAVPLEQAASLLQKQQAA